MHEELASIGKSPSSINGRAGAAAGPHDAKAGSTADRAGATRASLTVGPNGRIKAQVSARPSWSSAT